MSEIPTRLEFGKALLDISCGYASLVIAETEDQADLDREKYLQGRETAFAAYNAQAERNAELECIAELAMEWAANYPYECSGIDNLAADTIYSRCERAGIGQSKEVHDDNAT